MASITCPDCKGGGFTKLSDAWEVCDTCLGVGTVDKEPIHPATCAVCKLPLRWAGGQAYYRCLQHPDSRVVYYLQEPRTDYPPGWPLCRCGEPTVSGKATCGQYTCNTALAKAGGPSPRGKKP